MQKSNELANRQTDKCHTRDKKTFVVAFVSTVAKLSFLVRTWSNN